MLFEAIAAGLPIIASAVGGIPGFLEESGSGLLVRPRQPSDIVQAVLRLMRSNSFYCRLRENARTKASHYTLESERERMLNVIQAEILGEARIACISPS